MVKFVRRIFTGELRLIGCLQMDGGLEGPGGVCEVVFCRWGLIFADDLRFRGSWWSLFNCLSMKCDRES